MTYDPTRLPATGAAGARGPAVSEGGNLGDILERVLDKGVVIAGDIRVNLLDIELLTIKLRLLVVSVDTARELGIDWWERDPWLSGGSRAEELEEENRRLRDRLAALEERGGRRAVEPPARRRDAELPAGERGRRGRDRQG